MKYQDSHLDWTNGQTAQYIFSQCEGYLSMSSYYSNSFWFALAEQVDRRPRDTTQKQSLKCIFFLSRDPERPICSGSSSYMIMT